MNLRAGETVKPWPWAYVRRVLAQRWHVSPWAVDEAPTQEIELELRLGAIEADAQAWRERHHG